MPTQTQLKTNRSRKYQANLAKVQLALQNSNNGVLEISKAVETLMSLEQPAFKDGAMVELHVKLNINPTKSDQLIRSSVVLPNGTGKKIKIAAFVSPEMEQAAKDAGATMVGGESLIEEIKAAGKVDFDIAIAQPEMMKKLPAIARLLGTAGVMPNPKTGTVGDNVAEIINLIKAGKVDFKNDKTGNVHIPCGKINSEFTQEKLTDNVRAALEAVEKAKPEGVKKKYLLTAYLATSQSPSIRIA